MIGWRARLGFLVPPGNPTVETEMIALAPEGVSVHFHRMTARGASGSLDGQDERNRMMVANIDESVELLAMVEPDVITIAHTATSCHLGRQREAELLARLQKSTGKQVVTAFASVLNALERLNIGRLALGTPYSPETTLQGKTHLEEHGLAIVNFTNLPGVTNIYDETAERAYQLARLVDRAEAEAVFLSGTGPADIAGIGAAGARFGEAGDLERLRDDVACASSRRCATAHSGLWTSTDVDLKIRLHH
jgi:maleate isomerase